MSKRLFRHALFLVGHSLRKKVIEAIGHRSKAFVNGTQRYFAQVLANKIYKKAKAKKKQHLLSFDYFGVQAQSSTRGDGIYDLRQCYEEAHPDFFNEYKKDNNKQKPYSHLLDAQIAFLLACDEHRGHGKQWELVLMLKKKPVRQGIDTKTGEILPLKYFNQTHIPEKRCSNYQY